jgi:hypothetical protein
MDSSSENLSQAEKFKVVLTKRRLNQPKTNPGAAKG